MACRNCYKYPLCESCESPKGSCEKPWAYQMDKNFKRNLDMKEHKMPEDNTETYSFSEIGGTRIYWKRRKTNGLIK